MNRVHRMLGASLAVLPWACRRPPCGRCGEAGLPQLKIGTWPSQLFWLVVIFAVGYASWPASSPRGSVRSLRSAARG